MKLSYEECSAINAKLEGMFELRDLMMKVRRETIDIEKNSALTEAINLSFELTRNYLDELTFLRTGVKNVI
jgi:hypothetical protein